jgi:hypothetical protein
MRPVLLALHMASATGNDGRGRKRSIRWRNRVWSPDGLSGAVALAVLVGMAWFFLGSAR